MPLNATKKAIFAKTETTYGTAISTNATNAILVSNLEVQPFEGDQVDRNLVKPYFGASDILTANGRTRVTFSVELAGTRADCIGCCSPLWPAAQGLRHE